MNKDFLSTKQILVVDDTDTVLLQVKQVLGKNYPVRTLNSAKKMLEMARTSPPPDIILMDIEMPEMSGIEGIKALKGIAGWAKVPVLMLTSWNQNMVLEHCFSVGVLDVIHKPVTDTILFNRVSNYLKLVEYIEKYGDS
jgi:CheY-like chemotaxis protein